MRPLNSKRLAGTAQVAWQDVQRLLDQAKEKAEALTGLEAEISLQMRPRSSQPVLVPVEPTASEPDGYLRVADVAQRLGLCDDTVRKLVTTGQLPGVQFGRALRIPAKAITDYVSATNERMYDR